MVKVYTLSEVSTFEIVDGVQVDLTAEARQAILEKWNAYEAESPQRKLTEIKKIRLRKLQETDYLANSDLTMPDNIATWRQTLRDIPANHTNEAAYDLLLAQTDRVLTHSIWTKP